MLCDEVARKLWAWLDRVHVCATPQQLGCRLARSRADLDDPRAFAQSASLHEHCEHLGRIPGPAGRVPLRIPFERLRELGHGDIVTRSGPRGRGERQLDLGRSLEHDR